MSNKNEDDTSIRYSSNWIVFYFDEAILYLEHWWRELEPEDQESRQATLVIIIYAADLATDIYIAKRFLDSDDRFWALGIAGFILMPSLYSAYAIAKGKVRLLHAIGLGPLAIYADM